MPRMSATDFEKIRKVRPGSSQPTAEKPKPIEEEPAAAPVQVIERRIEMVMVEVPLGEPSGHQSTRIHVDASTMTPLQKETFARLYYAARDKRAAFANGRPVVNWSDCVRWLLEIIGQAANSLPTPPDKPA